MVKQLTDEELVLSHKAKRTKIVSISPMSSEHCSLLGWKLAEFQRDVICLALSVDKTEVSRMISIATALPGELLEAIGPAQKTGVGNGWTSPRRSS